MWVWASWSVNGTAEALRQRRWWSGCLSSVSQQAPHTPLSSLSFTTLSGRDGDCVMKFLKVVVGGEGG